MLEFARVRTTFFVTQCRWFIKTLIVTELLLSLLSSKSTPSSSPLSLILKAADSSSFGSTSAFLSSRLVFKKDKNDQDICLLRREEDGEEVGVMMGWERGLSACFFLYCLLLVGRIWWAIVSSARNRWQTLPRPPEAWAGSQDPECWFWPWHSKLSFQHSAYLQLDPPFSIRSTPSSNPFQLRPPITTSSSPTQMFFSAWNF